ncbi:MAG TPA: hypothetical protein VLC71_08200 [Thermomonas sp.]|nr:hypothetical protein [Thermomonas sp.]
MSDVEPESEVVSEEWHDGPMDWPDVPVIQRALETWESGPRIDFDISENLFFQLLECDDADDDFFSFQPGKVRWKDMSTSGHAGRKQLADWQSAGNLDFPIKFSRAARWYCFANTYTPCSLPVWVPKVLEATNWDAARAVLEVAQDEARDELTSAAQVFAHMPKRPALAYAEARALEQVARERVRAVEGCIEALARALREAESPPGVGVIVQIGGRDAIPVRALPYVTGWALAPDTLVKLLHNTSKHWPSTYEDRPRSPWLTAYRLLPNGDCHPVPPKDWQLVEIAIEGFDSELDASQHDHRHGYAQWRRRAMEHFPFDCFVWRDELEAKLYDVPEWNRVVRLGDDLTGGGKLNYAPLLLPGMREMVMEGFEESARPVAVKQEVSPSGNQHRKTKQRQREGDDAIQLALSELKATAASLPAQIEGEVRTRLLTAAGAPGANIGFKNADGVLQTQRAGKWSVCEASALKRRIETQLQKMFAD